MTTKRARVEAEVLRRLALIAAHADHLADHRGLNERQRHRVASVRPSDISRHDEQGRLLDSGFTTSEVTAALKRLRDKGWAALNPYSTRKSDKDWILTDPSKPSPTLPPTIHTHETLRCATCRALITLGCSRHIEAGHTDACPDRPEVALKKIKIQCGGCGGEGEYNSNEGMGAGTKRMVQCFHCRASGQVWERLADRIAEREERRLAR